MVTFTCRISDSQGLHARPASMFVKEAEKLTARVTVKKGEKSIDAKKIFAVMGLGVKQNDEITIFLEGEKETEEAKIFEEYIKNNL